MDKTKTNLKKKNLQKILILEYLTIAWNVAEGIISITIGIISGSISLFAFGLESGIEVFSSSVTVWELKGIGNGRRKCSLKMIGIAFLVVSIYVAFSAINSLIKHNHSDPAIIGIVYMALVSIIMSILGYKKRKLGKKMKNPVILAESNFTFLDVTLSMSILCGLLAHALFGWWWTDQILALVIAGNAFLQGVKGLKEGC